MQACKQVQPSHCLPGRKGRKDGRANGAEEEGRREGTEKGGRTDARKEKKEGRKKEGKWLFMAHTNGKDDDRSAAVQCSPGRSGKKGTDGRTNKACLSVCQSLSSPFDMFCDRRPH